MTWQVDVLTLFPEMFPGFLGYSLAGRALEDQRWSLKTHALREFGLGRHKAVDDTPFGGGAGMVIRADILDTALEATKPEDDRPIIYLSPKGRLLQQADVVRYASGQGAYFICGRYEGVDERIFQKHTIEEVSIGDYVLSGGEPAALILMDACVRLLPGVMGSDQSGIEESFSSGLLEYPHYTKPAQWDDYAVPEILLSGNHGAIASWRKEQAENATRQRRPDLWESYQGNRK
ncbi:tRNA G37 N-methylase TrmD (TrmD) (PDB:1P9P) [Commensalibacter communis]|uniref:tRNA (guanosine(37)-N1)-methyltransferase TrmD n=1 Tax=Commensalibacter communis TaxID=2972786 RepID=UPI0022FF852B|nr:tRNA (guanosine(37)-N1)-methyltransferase TrmD [Commensalibacter communis]CAI3926162.1 tRNA G37 N-methylase TrmD (TrmD) (PDB:1P9P) [Commensalibacter communis]CAI3932989.1 tRNA G37 N-methylase TrmD (TrmD) (PDB:1P9P) [Commensalibacter communis]